MDSSDWDVPAGEAALPAYAGYSQHAQVAKSLLAVDTKLAVLCLMLSPTASCRIPLAKPYHDWGSCWSSGHGAVLWKDVMSHSTPGTLSLEDSPLSAHLCWLQECRDPGAFVNIGEPCTAY